MTDIMFDKFNDGYGNANFECCVNKKKKTINIVTDHITKGKILTNFKVGDTAIYDSWNLYYTGTITNITDKAVTIHTGWYKDENGNTSSRVSEKPEIKRLNIRKFVIRNYDYDEKRIADYNAEEMMYL